MPKMAPGWAGHPAYHAQRKYPQAPRPSARPCHRHCGKQAPPPKAGMDAGVAGGPANRGPRGMGRALCSPQTQMTKAGAPEITLARALASGHSSRHLLQHPPERAYRNRSPWQCYPRLRADGQPSIPVPTSTQEKRRGSPQTPWPLSGAARPRDPGQPCKMAPLRQARHASLTLWGPPFGRPRAGPAACDCRPARHTVQTQRCEARGGRTHLTSPHRTSPPDRPAGPEQRARRLARPHGPRRPAAPPAQGGHVAAPLRPRPPAAPGRLRRAAARDSLSGSPQRRGSGAGQSAAVLAALGPLATPPGPANQATVAVATAWRQSRRLTSTELRRGAPKRGLEKGGGGWVAVSDPQTKKGGDVKKGPLTTPKRKTTEEKDIHLSKKWKSGGQKHVCRSLKTNEKVRDKTFRLGHMKDTGLTSLINEELLR